MTVLLWIVAGVLAYVRFIAGDTSVTDMLVVVVLAALGSMLLGAVGRRGRAARSRAGSVLALVAVVMIAAMLMSAYRQGGG